MTPLNVEAGGNLLNNLEMVAYSGHCVNISPIGSSGRAFDLKIFCLLGGTFLAAEVNICK
jgi:hypothetical protein